MTESNRSDGRSLSLILALIGVLTVAAIIWLAWSIHHSSRAMDAADSRALKIERLLGIVVHLDELLTMSARMAAATGELLWEQPYLSFEPELDAAVREAMDLAVGTGSHGMAQQAYEANQRLVDLVRRQNLERAQALLLSVEYEREKERYSRGTATSSWFGDSSRFGDSVRTGQIPCWRQGRRGDSLNAGNGELGMAFPPLGPPADSTA